MAYSRNNPPSSMSGGQKLALVVGIAAAAGAIYLLTQDAWETGEIKSVHVILPLIMLVTIGAGKLLYSAARDGVRSSAAGFALIFALGTGIVVVESVGKQAENYDATTSSIRKANEQRLAISGDIARLEREVADADFSARWEIAGRPIKAGVRDLAGRPTGGKGCGSQCKAYQALAEQKKAELATVRARLATLPAYRKADAKAEHWADLAITLGLLAPERRGQFVKALALAVPPLRTLVLDLCACWALGFAFYRRHDKRAARDGIADATGPGTPIRATPELDVPPGEIEADVSGRNAAAIAYIEDYRAKAGRNPSIRHVCQKFEMPRSTAHRYIKQYATA